MSRRRPVHNAESDGSEGSTGSGDTRSARASSGAAGLASGWSPRDLLVPYILLAVSLQRAHGYLIEEYLKSLGFFAIEMSTLYRTLRQLEKDGLLMSTWEPGATGPSRRVYSLTEAGQAWLDSWSSTLEMYRGMIDQFFDLYTPRARSQSASQAGTLERPDEPA